MSLDVSLVIATYNRAEVLSRLLGWLCSQTLERSRWEVVVVVDGSSDDTVARLEDWQGRNVLNLNYHVQANSGPAAARHLGITKAKGQRIVIIDDDMEPAAGFLAAHLQAANAEGDVVVIGQIKPTADWQAKPLHDATGEFARATLHVHYQHGRKDVTPEELATGNVSFPRQLYLDVGGFDLSLRVDEDRELGIRFGRHGARFVFSTAASAVHHSDVGRFTSWKNRQYLYGQTAVKVWRKHGQEAALHPLRDYVRGSRLNHAIVTLCVPVDGFVVVATAFLHAFGGWLQSMGVIRPAIATHQAIRALQFHRGVKDTLGGWRALRAEATKFRLGPVPKDS